MPVVALALEPFMMDINTVYSGDEVSLPYRDLVSEGVVGAGHYAVTQRGAGANMSVDVAAGVGWVAGDSDVNAQPVYRQRNAATVNVTISPADVTNPRIDRVVLRIEDDTFDSSGNMRGVLETVTGTPASSPSAPAEPNSSITLATVFVAANATSITNANITDARPFARTALAVPSGAVTRSSAQAIPTDTTTTLVLGTTGGYLQGGMKSDGTGLIIPSSGIYIVQLSVNWEEDNTGTIRQATILANGGSARTVIADPDVGLASGFGGPTQDATVVGEFSAGDLVRAAVYHDGNATVDVLASTGISPRLTATRLGALD